MDSFYEVASKRISNIVAQLDCREITINYYSGDDYLIEELNMLLDFNDNLSYRRFTNGIEVWRKGDRVSELRVDPKLRYNTGRQLIKSWIEEKFITEEDGMRILEDLLKT